MNVHVPWSCTQSLAGLDPRSGRAFRVRFRVRRILFGLVRDRCFEVGLREGQEIRCQERTSEKVVVEVPGGSMRELELPCARFVEVEPIPTDLGWRG